MHRLLIAWSMAACSLLDDGTPDPEPEVEMTAPKARTESVTDTFHGTPVDDPYRWLEDADSAEVAAFTEAQNTLARAALATYPVRDALKMELTALLGAERTTHGALAFAGGRIFAMRRQPPKRQSFLVELEDLSIDAPARTLVDPDTLDADGLVSIDWYVPSPDGTRVAVSLSRAGTESGDLHIYDVATGELVEAPLPRVNGGTAGGSLVWDADSQGVFYTRYPREGERSAEDLDFYVQLWHHDLGADPADDRYEIGKDFPRIAEIDVAIHHATGRLLVTVQDGDGGEFAHWLRDADGAYRQLSSFGDGTLQITFSEDGSQLLAISRTVAPTGRLLRFGVGETVAEA
ncbi:MAG: S9 family peptidase, partial [Myxococcota bacterium]